MMKIEEFPDLEEAFNEIMDKDVDRAREMELVKSAINAMICRREILEKLYKYTSAGRAREAALLWEYPGVNS